MNHRQRRQRRRRRQRERRPPLLSVLLIMSAFFIFISYYPTDPRDGQGSGPTITFGTATYTITQPDWVTTPYTALAPSMPQPSDQQRSPRGQGEASLLTPTPDNRKSPRPGNEEDNFSLAPTPTPTPTASPTESASPEQQRPSESGG